MLKTIILFSSIVLLRSCWPQSEEVKNCLFYKNMFSRSDSADITVQPLLPLPVMKIHYWVLNEFNRPIVIPVDNYKEIVVFASEDATRVRTILLRGSIYSVILGEAMTDIINEKNRADNIHTLKLGLNTKLSDISCSSDSLKNDNRTLLGIGQKTLMLEGDSNYLNVLDDSNRGWLFTSQNDHQKTQWSSLFVSPDNFVFGYKISRINTSDFKQLGGLLSQSQHYITNHAAKNPPDWMHTLKGAFDISFNDFKEAVFPTLRSSGFESIDTGSPTFLGFEKK